MVGLVAQSGVVAGVVAAELWRDVDTDRLFRLINGACTRLKKCIEQRRRKKPFLPSW